MTLLGYTKKGYKIQLFSWEEYQRLKQLKLKNKHEKTVLQI
jgi:hypothetical protein